MFHFSNNVLKICLQGHEITSNIEMKYLFHFKAYFYREMYFIQVAKKSLAKESWRSGFTF